MRGAIIGFGTIAQGHMYAYQSMDSMSISSVVDCCEARLHFVQQIYPHTKVYTTIEEMLEKQKVDFIDICSPPDTHLEYIKKALLADCHVLCEKPFLIDPKEYLEVISLSQSIRRCVYPSHNYKFAPILKWMKEQVQSYDFGRAKRGHFRTLRKGHAVGVKEWLPNWRRIPEISSGGIIRDHGTHSIYLACYILEQHPIAVSCIMGNLNKNDDYSSTEDTALITLYFENDVQFLIDLSWASIYRHTHYSVMGSLQSIIVDNDNIWINKNGVFKMEQITSEFDDPSHKTWFSDMFNDFLNLVNEPVRQMALFQEAFITTTIIQKAYESAANRGEIIKIPLTLLDATTKKIN
ncbi:MAG: Gfo/Idh/MocA family oxidoreductase [Bacteroidetes bacterium]|nr:Gfo/Idh/MocA family oxidoreductase [Bacteroidota bacterium]